MADLSLDGPRLDVMLAQLGWELESLDIDLPGHALRIIVRRDDGLLLTFDARNGRASMTRERTERDAQLVGRRGDRFRAETIKMAFLGRTRHDSIKAGLASFASYLMDNAATPAIHGKASAAVLEPLLRQLA